MNKGCMLQAALACLLLFPLAAPAQDEAMMAAWEAAATPGPQHAQLAEHFAGSWDTKMTVWMDPVTPPLVETGRATSATELGGRHVRMEFRGSFMGGPFEGIGSTGYDNVRGQYVSTWKDNMSTAVMLSYGDYDPATATYTFRGEMPDPLNAGALVPIRETVRIVDSDHHVMEMFETRDGAETRTMRIEFTRASQ